MSTKLPSIPSVPTSDPVTYQFLSAVKTNIENLADLAGTTVIQNITTGGGTSGTIVNGGFDGTTGIETVSSLPSTNLYIGRVVYLTTDKKLYRFDGTGWIVAVAASDLTGQLVAAQIADAQLTTAKFASTIKPIEIVTTLPTVGTQGRVVFLTSDNKLYRDTGTAWVSVVPATDITGTLTDSQLAAIAAAKVTGTLTDAQLAAISAAKITGTLTDSQLAAISAAKITGTLTDAQLAAISAAKITGQITTTQITNNAITTGKLATGAVTANEIAANTITAGQIAALTITSAQIAANTITASQIAALTITSAQIAANTITASQIAADTITSGQIAANAITSSELNAGAVIAGKIAAGTIVSGDIAASTITGTNIAGSTITGSNIAAGTITASNLVANTITAGQIQAGAIGTTELAANAVTAAKIAAGTITTNEIAANTITAGNIAAGTITATQIAGATITADRLVSGTITAASGVIGSIDATVITTGTLNAARISAGTITADRFLLNSGVDLAAIVPGSLNTKLNATDSTAVTLSTGVGKCVTGSTAASSRLIQYARATGEVRSLANSVPPGGGAVASFGVQYSQDGGTTWVAAGGLGTAFSGSTGFAAFTPLLAVNLSTLPSTGNVLLRLSCANANQGDPSFSTPAVQNLTLEVFLAFSK